MIKMALCQARNNIKKLLAFRYFCVANGVFELRYRIVSRERVAPRE